MAIILSDDVLNQTTKCEMDFACLSSRTDHLCKVERAMGCGPVLFLRQGEEPHCYYNYRFGNSIICSCPVRLKLYNRYGI